MNPWEEDWSRVPSNSGGMPWEEDWGAQAPVPISKKSSDVKTALIQGLKEVPGAITGLADVPAGLAGFDRPFSRAADAAGEVTGFQPSKWAKEDEAKYSDAYKAQKAEIDAIDKNPNSTAADYARFYAQNPKYTGLNIVRSVPSMALGGVYGRALKGIGGSAVARGAAGEGAVMAGQQMESIDKNVDPQRAALASAGTGLVGGAVGAVGGRIAQKTGLADVDTLLAGGGRGTGPVDLVKRGIGKRVGGGIVQEGAEELGQSLTEQGAKNLAEGNPLSEGMMRAGFEGTLAGSAMGGAAGAISRSRNRQVVEDDTQSEREEPADQAAEAAQAAMSTPPPAPPAGSEAAPTPPPGNPLIEQQQAEQEQEARAQEAKDKRDALIAKVGGVVPIAGTNMVMFNGKPYHNDDTSGALDKQINKLQEAEDLKTAVRQGVESAYVSAYNDLNKTAIANGEKKPLTFSGITGAVAKLVGGAQDPADAASRISAQIDLKVGPNGKVSPEVELLQNVYQKLTGQEHPSVARVLELQKQEAKEKESAKQKPAVVQAAPKTEPKQLPEPTTPQIGGASAVGKNSGGSPAPQLVTVTRQGKQVQLPKETLAKDLATALTDPKKAPIIRDVTGSDTGTTMSFREAAIASLTRQKKATTDAAVENERKRIHKMLAGLGITESVVDKVSAMDAVDNPEMSEISENLESGIRTVNSPNAGIVDEQLSKKDREHKEAVDKILEEKKDVKTPDVTTAAETKIESDILEKRIAAAKLNKQKTIARAANSPYAAKVRSLWDGQDEVKKGITKKFDDLSLDDKAALVDSYEYFVNDEMTEAELDDEWADISRQQRDSDGRVEANDVPRSGTGILEDDSGRKRDVQEDGPGGIRGTEQGGTASTEVRSEPQKAPVVAIKKKRAVEKPEPQPEAPDASQDFKDALSDLGDILTKVGRANLMPEQEKDLMGVLTRLVGAAIRMGYSKIEAATKFVLDAVKKKFGAKAVVVTPARVKTAYKSSSFIERNVSKLPPSLQGPAFVAATNIKDLIQRGVMGLSFGHDLADAVAKTLPSARKFFDTMSLKESTKNRLEIEIDKIATDAYKVPDRDALNKFLKKSTRSQKWGFKPSWDSKAVVDPGMEAQFNSLSKASQDVAKRIFEHGYKSRRAMVDAVRAEIDAGFEEELSAAKEDQKNEIRQRRMSEMHLFDTQFRAFEGPYAPLSRFGEYVTVAKSQERLDAEKRNDTKWLSTEGSKPQHYLVSFHDSLGAAKWEAKQLESKYASTVGAPKQAYAKGMSEAPWSALRRLKLMVNEHYKDAPEDQKKALTNVNQLLKDLYLSTLAEASARKHDLNRKDIEGASDDMLRAFASKGKADAHFMAALLNTGKVQDALNEMRQEAHGTDANREGRAERTNVFNEILNRYAGSLDYRPTPVQDRLLMLNSVWQLLLRPAYYFQNATQTWAMSLPVLAGRHGYAKSASAISDAYDDLASGFGKDSAVKGFVNGEFNIDYMPIRNDEKAALKKLLELGILDIGLQRELGYFESRGGMSQPFVDLTHRLSTLVKSVETANRVTAALAAYRLAGGGTKGLDEAKQIVRTTHGDYGGFNAPSFYNKLPKLVVQFRKFQIVQLSIFARLANQSLKGETKEVRAAARASFAYMLGHYFVMAGALGMPAMSTIGMVLAATFGDEEEPEDFELMARRYINNDEVADILLKGAPTLAGMDLSGTLGAANMTSILPFTDIKLDSKKGYAETMLGLLGPALGGTAPKIAEGIGFMQRGEIYKGFERVLPNGLTNALKAYREAAQGATNKQGDLTLSPEEIDLWDSFLTAMSIRSQTTAKQQFANHMKFEFENFYKERTSEIQQRYVKAWREGDGDTMSDMRTEWQTLQTSKARNGFTRQSMSDLVRAPREQQKRERNTLNGVQFRKNNRQFVAETAGL